MSDLVFCAECGFMTSPDYEGCCVICGATYMGDGADEAHRLRAEIERLTRERDEARREANRLTDVLVSRHGGEPLDLMEELDEARAEIERLATSLEELELSNEELMEGQ